MLCVFVLICFCRFTNDRYDDAFMFDEFVFLLLGGMIFLVFLEICSVSQPISSTENSTLEFLYLRQRHPNCDKHSYD